MMINQLTNESPFFYEFQADFVYLDAAGEIRFIRPENRCFVNNQPIVARENALVYYQNYIEVLLQSMGKTFSGDRKARNEILQYFREISDTKINLSGNEISLKKPLSCKIGIYLVQNSKEFVDDTCFEDEVRKSYIKLTENSNTVPINFDDFLFVKKMDHLLRQKFLIHGIEFFNGKDIEPLILANHLNDEYDLYMEYQYDIGDHKQTVSVYENSISETNEHEILKTPFEWEGFDLPHSDFNELDSIEKSDNPSPSTVMECIELGESKTREFKSAMFYDHTKERMGSGIICAKTICSFLNTEGGLLFIGVNDDKTIQGISPDLSIVKVGDPRDKLKLNFDQMIRKFFSPFVHKYLNTEFTEIEGKLIWIVFVEQSNQPVFMKVIEEGKQSKVFYIRREASDISLDIEEFFQYYQVRWLGAE